MPTHLAWLLALAALLLACAAGGAEAAPVPTGPTSVYPAVAGGLVTSITVTASETDSFDNRNQFRVRLSPVELKRRAVSLPLGLGYLNDSGEIRIQYPELERQMQDIIRRTITGTPEGTPPPSGSLGPIGAFAATWLAPLLVFVAVITYPAPVGDEEQIDAERWLLIEELSPKAPGFRAYRPCRRVRLRGVTGFDWRGAPRAVKCPLPPSHAEQPELAILAGGADDNVNLKELPTLPRATSTQLVDGGTGDDVVIGSELDDILAGSHGSDGIGGGGGDDELWGNVLRFFAEDSTVSALDDDVLKGGAGNDLAIGSWGNDLIDGGDDGDNRRPWDVVRRDWSGYVPTGLSAFTTPNTAALQGGIGKDIVIGGAGADTMIGGEDRDTLLSKESDLGDPDWVDPLVDCNGSPLEDPSPDEFLRRSFGDAVSFCGLELQRPVDSRTLLDWESRSPSGFPWERWPTRPVG